MYSTQDTAARLGIDVSRVRRLATAYTIGTKIGPRAWVFTEADITRLQQHATGKAGRPSRPKSDVAR
jgi:activator of 2-hydroxyglutaryl-CoA dehydratase